jgi:hypothetical protein
MKSDIDIGVLLGAFIGWPWLALVPAALCVWAYRRRRRGAALVAALAWLAYFPYELGMKLRVLCSGECNIRVDLLLFYPILLGLSVWAIAATLRDRHPPER